jgi:hypothetical protein
MPFKDKARQKQASREHYARNGRTVRQRTAEKKLHRRRLALAYLRANPCIECGEPDPVVLDFDHVDPDDKKFNISNAIANTRSEEAMLAEMAKCEIRCANCHRRRTAQMNRWWKWTETRNDDATAGPVSDEER